MAENARPLTVVQMLPALDSGGVERGTLEVARELVRRGHRSIVISAGGRLVEQLLGEGSEHLMWPVGAKHLKTLLLIPRVARLLRERRPDILHLRSRLPAWIGYLAWRTLPMGPRPRLVTTVHGAYRVNRYSAIMTRGERIIAVSGTIRDYILTHYPEVPPERIQVIYRGIDPRAFPYGHRPPEDWLEAWRRDFPQAQGKYLINLPARITRLKGHDDFIRLMTALKARGLAVHGLIVGGAERRRQPYLDELRARVAAAGLEEWITFTGHRADLREVMAVSDLVLTLSRDEAFGRTTVEALTLGVPVIGYDRGGTGEVLERLYPAGRVPAGDLMTLEARVLEFMAGAPPVGRQSVFTLQKMLDETLALYRSLGNGTDER